MGKVVNDFSERFDVGSLYFRRFLFLLFGLLAQIAIVFNGHFRDFRTVDVGLTIAYFNIMLAVATGHYFHGMFQRDDSFCIAEWIVLDIERRTNHLLNDFFFTVEESVIVVFIASGFFLRPAVEASVCERLDFIVSESAGRFFFGLFRRLRFFRLFRFRSRLFPRSLDDSTQLFMSIVIDSRDFTL